MKNKRIIIALATTMIAVIMIFVVAITLSKQQTNQGEKQITVTVVYKDETEKDFSIKTDKEYLGETLLEEKLITDDEFKSGYYTFIDGIRADYNKDKAWWRITKNGEDITVSMNQLAISDGDSFEIIYTPA